MKTTVDHPNETSVRLTINLGAKELDVARQVALVKLSATVKVPGFRKGKVPASVAAKHIDPRELDQQLLNDAISRAVAEAFQAEAIQVLDRPAVEVRAYVPGKSLEFTAEAEVVPKIKLGNYKKLSVKSDTPEVTKEEVEEVIGRMRQGFAEKKAVDRTARDGDDTVIDFIGKRNDVAFDGGTGNDYTLTIGSHQFIPGFEEAIVGHKAGETFDVPLTFPAEYHAKDLAGQPVVFTVTLKSVTEAELPELDDAFAKRAGDVTDMKALRQNVEAEILAKKQQEALEKRKDALIDALIEASPVAVPEGLIADQAKAIEEDFGRNLTYRGLDLPTYLSANVFADEAAWRESEVRPAALRRVQASLVLSALSDAEAIEVDDVAVDTQIEAFKLQYGKNPEMARQLQDPSVRRDITQRMTVDKALDRLVELNP